MLPCKKELEKSKHLALPCAVPFRLPVGRSVDSAMSRQIGCIEKDRASECLAHPGNMGQGQCGRAAETAHASTKVYEGRHFNMHGETHRWGPPCGSCWANRTRASSLGARPSSCPCSCAVRAGPRSSTRRRHHCTRARCTSTSCLHVHVWTWLRNQANNIFPPALSQ